MTAAPTPGNVFGGSTPSPGNAFGGSAATPTQPATMAQPAASPTPAALPAPPTYTTAIQSPLGLVEATLVPPGTLAPQSPQDLDRVKSRRQTFSVSSQDSSADSAPTIPPQFHQVQGLVGHDRLSPCFSRSVGQWSQRIAQDSQGRYPGVQVAGLLRSANLEQVRA